MSFWMSLIMEDDKPGNPTDISLLYTVAEMIRANYFPVMINAAFCHYLRVFYYATIIYLDIPRNLTKSKTKLSLGYFRLFLYLSWESREDITQSITKGVVFEIRYSKDPFGAFKDMTGHYG